MLAYLTLTMELMGLSIALLETRFPVRAKRVETAIDDWESRLDVFIYRIMGKGTWQGIVTAAITIFFCILIPYWAGFWEAVGVNVGSFIYPIVIVLLCLAVFIILVMLLALIGDFIGLLNRFSGGHAIGSLGLLLALCGTLGEVLQMIF